NQKSRAISADVPRINAPAGKILGAPSERADLARKMENGARMESAVREVVRRRQTQHFGKLPGSASHWAAPEQGGNYLGRRTRRQTYTYLSTAASRSLPLRECPETKQHKKRRSRHHLSPEYSGDRDRHARLRANRCGAFSS